MRFLVTALVFGLASIAQAGAHDKHGGGKTEVKLSYDWSVSVSDENLGRDTEDDSDFKVRAIKNGVDAEIDFSKEWDGVKFSVSYNLVDGLESAVATAELPRSYLSVAVGKGALDVGGWQEYSSPYLSYHNPFETYGAMAKVFAPIEGFGELSLMITNDVKADDDDARWHNNDDAIIGLAQYKGNFGMVSPLLQFAMYDYKASSDDDDDGKSGWQSWVLAAGLKLAMNDLTVHLDYVHDNRKNKDGNDKHEATTTTYSNYTAGVYYKHGMVAPWASISMLMTKNSDEDREDYAGIDGNFMTPGDDDEDDDGDKDTAYEKVLKGAFDGHEDGYGDLADHQKYSTNMMVFTAGVEINCVNDALVPYISYKMKMHKLDPDWSEADSDTEDQISHSIAFGIYGVI